MGSITEQVLHSTKSITKPFDIKNDGRKLVKIVRNSDGKELTFTSSHHYSSSQIRHVFEIGRHFHGINGQGIVDTDIKTPFGIITPVKTTGLSNGEFLSLQVVYTGGNTGPALIPYTVPLNAFKLTAEDNSFTGYFTDSLKFETPTGTAIQKQFEFSRITDTITHNEFQSQIEIHSVSLPHVTTIGLSAFESSEILKVSLPEVLTIGKFAFWKAQLTELTLLKVVTIGIAAFEFSPLTKLTLGKVETIGDRAFKHIVNNKNTKVIWPAKFNTDAEKDRIFGVGNWDQIVFSVYQPPHTTNYTVAEIQKEMTDHIVKTKDSITSPWSSTHATFVATPNTGLSTFQKIIVKATMKQGFTVDGKASHDFTYFFS